MGVTFATGGMQLPLAPGTIQVTSTAFGAGAAATTTTASLGTLASAVGPAALAFIAFDIALGLICGSFAQAMTRYNDYMKTWGTKDPIALQKYTLQQQIAQAQQQLPSVPGSQRASAQAGIQHMQDQLEWLNQSQQAAQDVVAKSTLAELPIAVPAATISDAVAATYLPVAVSGAAGVAAVAVPAAGAAAGIVPAIAKGAALTTMLANVGLAIEKALTPVTGQLSGAQQTIAENPGTFLIVAVVLIFILLSRKT